MKTPFILASLLLFTGPCFGDDGSYFLQGEAGSAMPVKNTSITMTKEVIKIDLEPINFGYYRISYNCVFYFTNNTKSAQTVLIGFPQKLNVTIDSKEPSVSNFKYILNGKEESFQVFPTEPNPSLPGVPAYDVIYAKEIRFAPGESKIITNSFFLNKDYDSRESDPNGWNRVKSSETIDYILKTGATWNGPIGEADIDVVFHVPADFLTITAHPREFNSSPTPSEAFPSVHYRYFNFVPTEDIMIAFEYKEIPVEEEIAQLQRAFAEKKFNDVYLTLEKMDRTVGWSPIDRKTKDILRALAYKTAYQYYDADYQRAIALYVLSLHYAYSYKPADWFNIEFLEEGGDFSPAQWENEGEKNTPSYWSFYNIACEYARQGMLKSARIWFDQARKMKPDLNAYARKDPDMANLFQEDTPLIEACKKCDYEEIRDLLEKGAGVDVRGFNNRTPIIALLIKCSFAIDGNGLKCLNLLLDKNPDLRLKDFDNESALHYAVLYFFSREHPLFRDEKIRTLKRMMNSKTSDVQGAAGETPLMQLMFPFFSNKNVLDYFIENTNNIEIRDGSGDSVLFHACHWHGPDIIKSILQRGADINGKNNEGITPLMEACILAHYSVALEKVKTLIEAGAKINEPDNTGMTALMHVFDLLSPENKFPRALVKYLLASGADPNIRDLRGLNSFDVAVQHKASQQFQAVVEETRKK